MAKATISPDLYHFLRCARRGKHRAASGGEKRMRALAEAALEHAPGTDDSGLAGFAEFVRIAKGDRFLAEDLLQ